MTRHVLTYTQSTPIPTSIRHDAWWLEGALAYEPRKYPDSSEKETPCKQ